MKNSTWLFIIVLGLLHAGDLISTYLFSSVSGFQLESNPIGVLIGNFWIMSAITTLILIGLLYIYEKIVSTPIINFVYCSAFVSASILKIGAIMTNMYSYYHPPSIEYVNSLTPEIRIISYSLVVGVSWVYPFILSIIAFCVHLLDFKQENKNEEKYELEVYYDDVEFKSDGLTRESLKPVGDAQKNKSNVKHKRSKTQRKIHSTNNDSSQTTQ